MAGASSRLLAMASLIEFPSAVDAVQHAVDVQQVMGQRNVSVPDDRRMEIRMGINIGDVIVDGDDLFGDGVNVAARLEGLADPGGICVSGSAHEQVRHKLDLAFEDMGEQSVKNIDEPVRAYRIASAGEGPAALDAQQDRERLHASSDKPSIAVLPFDNMSGDPEQEYFSDGMAEDLITDLSKLSNLSVAARNSSFSFKGQMPDISEVAEKLGVAFVLEGSVRKMGERLRINAQLIDTADGRHLWAERYDGNMAEIFEFQDAMREQIVSALQVSLTPTDKAVAERKPTDSVEAYDLFLRGRANFYSTTREHTLEAIKFLEEAIEIDPNFADAYAFMAFCYFYGWFHMWPEFDDTLDRAYEFAKRGAALDSKSAVAVMRLGFIEYWMRRFDQAIPKFEKATALAPNNAEVCVQFGQMLNYWGDPERGMEMIEKALSLETFAPAMWEFYAGCSRLLLNRYDEAITILKRVTEQAPKFSPAHFSLAWAYVELARFDDAHDAIEAALGINSQYTLKEVDRLYPYRIDAVRNRFLDSLRKAGLPDG